MSHVALLQCINIDMSVKKTKQIISDRSDINQMNLAAIHLIITSLVVIKA